jgi:hypothetical protein
MSEQQVPTTQELTEFSLRAFKGIEAGLGQADPTAEIYRKLEAQHPGYLVLVQAGTFLHGYDRTAYALSILNDAAWSVIEEQRRRRSDDADTGSTKEYVFAWKGNRVDGMNNTAWQNARKKAGLTQVRIHDLRHTFATRLRLAGVPQEDRNALMGHSGASMAEHYAAGDIGRLIKLANRVLNRQGTKTLLRVVNG